MSKNTLRLSLETLWFEMTKAGIKREDYREITPYWCSRLLKFKGEKKTRLWWEREMKNFNFAYLHSFFTKVEFDYNVMTLGYPSNSDTSRILTLEHKGIEIRTGNPEWGAEPDKLYFVIKHGEIINPNEGHR
jgi:hypothetical protein